MKVLVTGASGFTGSHLANTLVEKGYEVYGLVRPASKVNAISPKVTLIKGDLTSRSDVDHAVQGKDIVYHIAALYRDQGASDQDFHDVNVTGTRHVMDS